MDHGSIWVLAMTATRARILRDLGDGTGAAELVMRADHRHLRALMEARPGLHGAPAGPGPVSAPGQVAADQRDFVRQVVQVLEVHRLAGDFAHLAVFAGAASLDLLRAEMPVRLAERIVAERACCVMHLGPGALARRVREEMSALEA